MGIQSPTHKASITCQIVSNDWSEPEYSFGLADENAYEILQLPDFAVP